MTKYKTGGYRELIEVVDVIKETEKSVFVMSKYRKGTQLQRVAKHCMGEHYFDTWAEAKAFLVLSAGKGLEDCAAKTERARKRLHDALAIPNCEPGKDGGAK